jgi:hypothetical protein
MADGDQLLFVWLLCIHKEGRLVGAEMKDLAFELHLNTRDLQNGMRRLRSADLLLKDNTPKGWNERQFESDLSTKRVLKHRRNVSETLLKRFSNGDVTPPETETETETEKCPPLPPASGGPDTHTEGMLGTARKIRDALVATNQFPNLVVELVYAEMRKYPRAKVTQEAIEAMAAAATSMPGVIGSPAPWIRARLSELEVGALAEKKEAPRVRPGILAEADKWAR